MRTSRIQLLLGRGRHFGSAVDDVANLHKSFEKRYVQKLAPGLPTLVRLDGHRFSRFTASFHKPYDWRLFRAMQLASADLLALYSPRAVYTQSDEVTLVFSGDSVPFAGKTQKFASLVAAQFSVRFGAHLRAQLAGQIDADLMERSQWGHFDARCFTVPTEEAALENLCWRQDDCARNSVNGLGALFFPQKVLQGKSPAQVREMLGNGPEVLWSDMHPHYRRGAILKKASFLRAFIHPLTGEKGLAPRTRPTLSHISLRELSPSVLFQSRLPPPADSRFFSLGSALPDLSLPDAPKALLLAPSLRSVGGARRFMRHVAAAHPSIDMVRWGKTAPSATLAVCGTEEEVELAKSQRCQVLWAGEKSAPSEVEFSSALDALLPEMVGLMPYEAGDEGIRAWHDRMGKKK